MEKLQKSMLTVSFKQNLTFLSNKCVLTRPKFKNGKCNH